MEILPKQPSVKAPAETFTGDAWYDVIARGTEPSRIRVNVVRFAPGTRNAWHSHPLGQTLHVTEGIGRVQSRGGEVIEIRPGDTVRGQQAEARRLTGREVAHVSGVQLPRPRRRRSRPPRRASLTQRP